MDENGIMKKKTRDGKSLINHNEFPYKSKYEGSTSLYLLLVNASMVCSSSREKVTQDLFSIFFSFRMTRKK